MRKAELQFMEKMESYKTYAEAVNVHQKPTEGINSGSHGRLFEMEVKAALRNMRGQGVSRAGQRDTVKLINSQRLSIEIKSGCGELARLNEEGERIVSILNSKLIIYAPEFMPGWDVKKVAFVFDTSVFYELLVNLNLVVAKKSSAQYKLPKNERFNDRESIQSFCNSKKKYNALMDALETKGILFGDWLEENNIY